MPKKWSTECTNHPPVRLCHVLHVLRDIRGTFKFLPEQYILRCTFFLISWHPNLFSSNMHIVLIFTGPKTQCNKMWHSKRRYTTAFYLVMLIIVFAVAVAVSSKVPYPTFFYPPRLFLTIYTWYWWSYLNWQGTVSILTRDVLRMFDGNACNVSW